MAVKAMTKQAEAPTAQDRWWLEAEWQCDCGTVGTPGKILSGHPRTMDCCHYQREQRQKWNEWYAAGEELATGKRSRR